MGLPGRGERAQGKEARARGQPEDEGKSATALWRDGKLGWGGAWRGEQDTEQERPCRLASLGARPIALMVQQSS